MIKENRKSNRRRIKARRFQERRKIHFPFGSEGWVTALERRKEYVLWPVIDRRIVDRRNGERRVTIRRLSKKHIQDKTVLKKEEIDYIFKLLSKSNKVKATADL